MILISARFHGLDQKIHFSFNSEIVTSNFRFLRDRSTFKRSLINIFGIEKSTDIISDHLDDLSVP